MKIRFGNIFDAVTTGVIIHGCNAQGVMGSGVALEVKTRYPEAYNLYKRYCDSISNKKELLGATPAWTNSGDTIDPNRDLIIINAITQEHYGRAPNHRYVSYEAIQECFDQIHTMCKVIGVSEVNFPLIGAGLGGGDWQIISEIIKDSMQGIDQTLWLLNDR